MRTDHTRYTCKVPNFFAGSETHETKLESRMPRGPALRLGRRRWQRRWKLQLEHPSEELELLVGSRLRRGLICVEPGLQRLAPRPSPASSPASSPRRAPTRASPSASASALRRVEHPRRPAAHCPSHRPSSSRRPPRDRRGRTCTSARLAFGHAQLPVKVFDRADNGHREAGGRSRDLPAATRALRRRVIAAQHRSEHLHQLGGAWSSDTTPLLTVGARLACVGG